jgi:hypothetical protein
MTPLSIVMLTHSATLRQAFFLRPGKKAPLRVNPEPLGFTRGLEFVERQAQVLGLGSRRVDNPKVNV